MDVIPDNVIMIVQEAFNGYRCLKEEVIPDSVQMIDTTAFRDCSCLSDIMISGKKV